MPDLWFPGAEALLLRITDNMETTAPKPLSARPLFLVKLLLSICLAASVNIADATTRYVKAGASGGGTSWSDASGDLQAIINASVSGDMVWVAGGTYIPMRRADNATLLTPGDRNNAFVMINGVGIYGGFAGTETTLSARDLTLTVNASILSGDLNKDDAGFTNNGENAYHVIVSPGSMGAAVLDGFTIQGGNCNGSIAVTIGGESIGQNGGGGIFCSTSSPTLNNLTITGNAGRYGAGAVFSASSSLVTATRLTGNAGFYGGAVLCSSSNATFANVLISGNTAVEQGGGMYNQFGTVAPVLTNATITGNTAGNAGGAMYNDLSASLKISNCIIYGNNSDIFNNSGTPAIQYSLVQGLTSTTGGNISGATDPLFINPVVAGLNTGGDYGLQPCSPVVDKGNNSVYATGQTPDLSGVTTDLVRKPRMYNGGTVDMGAFERQGVAVTASGAGIIYVKAGATGSGTSWACAAGDLQAAIDAAVSGNMVWVAGGSYQRGNGQYFSMKEGVKIYGGFAGTETSLSLRDITNTANASTVRGNNTSVFFNSGLTTAALLDGFTITGGSNAQWGAGMFNYYASPTVSNCIFTGNTGTWGGGAATMQASAVFVNCTFNGNTARTGGGCYDNYSSSTFVNCTFSGNKANWAGGVFIIKDNHPSGRLTGCRITGNSSAAWGGGLTIYMTSVDVSNCTIAGNLSPAGTGGGVYFTSTTTLVSTLRNSIVYGNSSGIEYDPSGIQTMNISNSLVQGLPATANGNIDGAMDPRFVSLAGYAAAPTMSGDYHLQYCSPAINAGSNAIFNSGLSPDLSGITTDLDGAPRIQGAAVDMGAYEFGGGNNGNPIPADLLAINGDAAAVTLAGPTTITATASVCRIIATVQPDGSGTSIGGAVQAKAYIESAQPVNFVMRHYQIDPGTRAATGRVTLYFTQAEFDAFNAINTLKLPTGPGDAAGISNLLVEQYPGASVDGSGSIYSYPVAPLTIHPADANIVWNSATGRWEISFAVTGFGGFFVKTQLTVLPLQLLSFGGTRSGGCNLLEWTTADEVNTKYFELESRTGDGGFVPIATIDAAGAGSGRYSYKDAYSYGAGRIYYRLKMVDADGRFTFSQTISLVSDDKSEISLFPNPANDVVYISAGSALMHSKVALYDAGGKLLQTILIAANRQPINVQQLPEGLYFLKFADGTVRKFIKR